MKGGCRELRKETLKEEQRNKGLKDTGKACIAELCAEIWGKTRVEEKSGEETY